MDNKAFDIIDEQCNHEDYYSIIFSEKLVYISALTVTCVLYAP